ncbi:hypothetical protein Cni_G28884 [Canna indica]|uniref:Uncharacterized protein n=1 Tax=Canna indica TaxID=4628 RepID=A0AAQ3L3A7_9LILI|nr:hypothetical protein Cni_G28884 [Canna indica]
MHCSKIHALPCSFLLQVVVMILLLGGGQFTRQAIRGSYTARRFEWPYSCLVGQIKPRNVPLLMMQQGKNDEDFYRIKFAPIMTNNNITIYSFIHFVVAS